MSDQSGRLIKVGIAKEPVRGTGVTPFYWLPQTTIDLHNKNKQVQDDAAYGVLSKYQRTDIVEQWGEGKVEGYVRDKSFGLLMLAALGSSSSVMTADASNNVYATTFTASQSNIPQSMTLTRKDTNSDFQFARAMLKTLEIDVVVGAYVKFSSDWMSMKGATQSDTPAFSTENLFRPKHAVAKIASTTSGLSGATAMPLKELKLTITRTINPYYVFGSNDPGEIFTEDFTVAGDFVLRYTDQTYENLFYANTQQALSLDLKNTDVTIGTSANPELLITLPQLTFSDWTPDQNKDKINEQTIAFQGQYNIAAAAEISAVLTNLVTSY